MKYVVLFMLAALVLVRSATGQIQSPFDLFPHTVGDTWVYSAGYDSVAVTGTVQLKNQDYFVYASSAFGTDTLRFDPRLAQVFRYDAGKEYVLYDLSLPDSAIYWVPDFFAEAQFDSTGYLVQVNRPVEVETPLGHFRNAIALWFFPSGRDGDWAVYFAPDVGIVAKVNIWFSVYLEAAHVGGVTVTSREPSLPDGAASLELYPNPVGSQLTVRFEDGLDAPASIDIIDVLGRTVLRVPALASARPGSFIQVDVRGLAPGVYGLTYRTKKGVQTTLFIKR